MPYKDPEKKKQYRKEWGKKNDYTKMRERKSRQFKIINKIKLETGCEHCGFKEHPAALEFHHKIPEEKEFSISAGMGWKLERILKEIEKCIILCSNCHAIEEHRLNDNSLY